MLIGVAALTAPLVAPTASWAGETKSAASADKPSQAQWKQLGEVGKKHSALGVFGAEDNADPVLMLPEGASAGEKSKALADIPAEIRTKVKVKVSRFKGKEVDTIQKDVMGAKWNKNAGRYGLGAFYDGETDKVIVNSDAPDSVTASLKGRYGDKVEVVRSRFEQQISRFNDLPQFYGGDSIHTDSWGACTSGFKVHVTNPETGQAVDMMTTAGHCYNLNELVRGGTNNNMGWVKRFGEADLEAFVGYQYSARFWTGGTASSTASLVTHSLSGMYNGLHVCVSGQTSFNHCGHPITNNNYAFNWTDHNGHQHHTNSWDGFTYGRGGTNYPRYDNGPITQGGDSGAPIYVPSGSGTAAATGTHSGIVSWNCDACSGHTEYRMYGVKANYVHNTWGGYLSSI
ncbi:MULTISPECIES: hypothetical protein [Streptomyces]|uniref:Uncharacterized protein n=2 Tax=Streptomyces TaxID=1883 RepID=A0ABV9J9Z6_9ACTN